MPSVKEVAVGLGGAGRLHAVVALNAPRPGEARKAMFAIWAAVNLIKQVIVVDGDIDPWNALEVEWASATRVKPERDFVIIREFGRIGPSLSSRAAPSASLASMPRSSRKTGRLGCCAAA